MITAKEARERVYNLEKERFEEEKVVAESKIEAALKEGKTTCMLGIYVTNATKTWLESYGYAVQLVSVPMCDNDTMISW